MARPAPTIPPAFAPPTPSAQPATAFQPSPASPDRAIPSDQVTQLQGKIRAFDSQRATAANAVFRLGELYRNFGRANEAKVQYARILREFTDFPDLVQISQKMLALEYEVAMTTSADGAPGAQDLQVPISFTDQNGNRASGYARL
jgi:hypothetical protein